MTSRVRKRKLFSTTGFFLSLRKINFTGIYILAISPLALLGGNWKKRKKIFSSSNFFFYDREFFFFLDLQYFTELQNVPYLIRVVD